MRPDILAAAARRFLVLLGGISAVLIVGGLLAAAVSGASLDRAISLGFYAAGAFLVVGGFLLGNRGPYRAEGHTQDRVGRQLRRATADDVRESANVTMLFTVLGFVLLALGVIIDSRFELL